MADESLFSEIIAGTTKNENPADVLFLCSAMATAKFARSIEGMSGVRSSAHPAIFTKILRLSGEILCPIFAVVKPEDFIQNMESVRRQYAGVATSPSLQKEYGDILVRLLDDGELLSLQQAIDHEIWKHLQRRQRGRGRSHV